MNHSAVAGIFCPCLWSLLCQVKNGRMALKGLWWGSEVAPLTLHFLKILIIPPSENTHSHVLVISAKDTKGPPDQNHVPKAIIYICSLIPFVPWAPLGLCFGFGLHIITVAGAIFWIGWSHFQMSGQYFSPAINLVCFNPLVQDLDHWGCYSRFNIPPGRAEFHPISWPWPSLCHFIRGLNASLSAISFPKWVFCTTQPQLF